MDINLVQIGFVATMCIASGVQVWWGARQFRRQNEAFDRIDAALEKLRAGLRTTNQRITFDQLSRDDNDDRLALIKERAGRVWGFSTHEGE